MRGVVSLATALSIPLVLSDGTLFPQRSLIIFITFVVIFITLVFQGLTLPFIIKLINIKEIDDIPSSEEQQAQIQLLLDKNALKILNENFHSKSVENDLLGIYKENLENNVENLNEKIASLDCDFSELKKIDEYNAILKQIYALQRKELFRFRKEKLFSDEEIRKAEMQLDLNDLKISKTEH